MENSIKLGEIAGAQKFKIVEEKPPTLVEQTSRGVSITDPDKIMRDLPADEFFRLLEESTPEQLQIIIQSFEKGARTKGGSKLLSEFIDVPSGRRTILSTAMWWEWRRPFYNLILGLVGIPSVALLSIIGMSDFAVWGMLFYAICANVCYSLGTPAELLARACWKDKAQHYGPVLLTLGTIFSVILTVCLELLVTSVLVFSRIMPHFYLQF